VRHRTPSSQGVSLGDFLVTCYDLQGTTASGAPVSTVTVAVDPSVIPMGAEIDIAGVGVRIAQDTGGAIVGHRLDIWEPTYQGCMDWGARTEPVTLLRP
jgi:3D (Asp-Asp-Asp) domain-containing protein